MLDFLNITKAIADENRLRILMLLQKFELCVCQITTLLDLAPSTTSKHLSILRQARLIESRKKGKWVYYALPAQKNRLTGVENALRLVFESLSAHPDILHDEKKLHSLLAEEETFCLTLAEGSSGQLHSHSLHLIADSELEQK